MVRPSPATNMKQTCLVECTVSVVSIITYMHVFEIMNMYMRTMEQIQSWQAFDGPYRRLPGSEGLMLILIITTPQWTNPFSVTDATLILTGPKQHLIGVHEDDIWLTYCTRYLGDLTSLKHEDQTKYERDVLCYTNLQPGKISDRPLIPCMRQGHVACCMLHVAYIKSCKYL